MLERHWQLSRDPFAPGDPTYVSLPGHEEAVARLIHAVDVGERLALLTGAAGLGKTTVLTRALDFLRLPQRRIVRIAAPVDGSDLLVRLAEGLGRRVDPASGRARHWQAIREALRLARLQGLGLVLAIEESEALNEPADRHVLARLVACDAPLTILWAGRSAAALTKADPWTFSARLEPLTRTEAARYLDDKLTSAGRVGPTFTPRAATRLHALTGGVPRGLDRLASLALRAAAGRGLEIVPPEVVDGVAAACLPAA